jgi:hypothetical protein
LDVGGRARASKNMKAVEGGALLWNENEKPLTVGPRCKEGGVLDQVDDPEADGTPGVARRTVVRIAG